jgi:hypothetical protein
VNKSTIGLQKIIHRELLRVPCSPEISDLMKDPSRVRAELAFLSDDTAVGEITFPIKDSGDVKRVSLMTISDDTAS